MTEDPAGFLLTEARIIAENNTHAVITLRIDKAFFARNMRFMAALAELMPRDPAIKVDQP